MSGEVLNGWRCDWRPFSCGRKCNPRWRYEKEGAIGLAAESAREQLSLTIQNLSLYPPRPLEHRLVVLFSVSASQFTSGIVNIESTIDIAYWV